jgi:uncharacterized protein (TIGR03792 family)
MIIEQLTFRVPAALRQRYLDLDAQIWTAALAAQPGFLGKECWIEAADPEVLHLIIRWRSRADWKAVPAPVLQATDQRFVAALGQDIPVLRCLDQEVQRQPGG